MSRKWFIAIAVVLIVGGTAMGLLWRVYEVPEFYDEISQALSDPEARRSKAREFSRRTEQLGRRIEREPEWSARFGQAQVNSWLAENLDERYPGLLPDGVTDPRVVFEKGVIRIGFRFRKAGLSSVVSLAVRPSVPRPNRLVLEIESLRAGLLPMSIDRIRQMAGEFAGRWTGGNWSVQWTEQGGRDIAVVDLAPNQGVALESVEVEPASIRITGRTEADDRKRSKTAALRADADRAEASQ